MKFIDEMLPTNDGKLSHISSETRNYDMRKSMCRATPGDSAVYVYKYPSFQKKEISETNILPLRGGSNEYPQSMFWSKNKNNRYTPAYPSFAI